MGDRYDLIRRLAWMLALVAVAMAGAGLVLALRSLPGAGAPVARSAAADLVHEYPLGERSLCCSQRDVPRGGAMQVDAPRSAAAGKATLWPLAAVPVLVALAVLGWGSQRFSRRDGYWVRTRPRRRWTIGPRGHQLAQALGFRYSRSRDALVPGVRGGHFGPVLKLQGAIEPMQEPASVGIDAARDATAFQLSIRSPVHVVRNGRGASEWPHTTVDMACLPHPYSHAGIWQLTAVELRSGFTWARLVRRRSGKPTAQQTSAFVHTVADDLAHADLRLATLIMHDPPPLLVGRDALPSDVVLLTPEETSGRPRPAAAVHELLFEHHRRAALRSPITSFPVLQRQLQRWVAAHNAERGTALAWSVSRGHGG